MHVLIRFIGEAHAQLSADGHEERRFQLQLSAEVVHVGDLVRHPLFPDRHLYVVAREVDLAERAMTLWLDFLPEYEPRNTRRRDQGEGAGESREPSALSFSPHSPAIVDD